MCDGQAVLKYLAPYIYRVAISDNRIVACDEESVTFRWTPVNKKKPKTRSVSGEEFLRGFLQHILPRGYEKVRHCGWMSSNCRISLDLARWLVWLLLGWTFWLGSGHAPQPTRREPPPRKCEHCGGQLVLIAMTIPRLGLLPLRTLPPHGPKYLDSG
jgi:hypothetical protein